MCALWHFRLGDRAAAIGTVRREPIETADRGVAVACVRSGISGWVIGLLIGWRAVAERRAANTWSPVLADSEARRRFLFGTRSLNPADRGVRVPPWLRVSSRARGRRLGQRFRSGGAGAQLSGLFGASRSKPLTEG